PETDGSGLLRVRNRHSRPFEIDPAELVAFVRVAGAVERPGVARTHKLVVSDVALGEVVVEMRATPGRAAKATVHSPPQHVFLTRDVDRTHLTGRHGRRRKVHYSAKSWTARAHSSSVAPRAIARPRT